MIVRKEATLLPIAELRKLTASLLTPTIRSVMASKKRTTTRKIISVIQSIENFKVKKDYPFIHIKKLLPQFFNVMIIKKLQHSYFILPGTKYAKQTVFYYFKAITGAGVFFNANSSPTNAAIVRAICAW